MAQMKEQNKTSKKELNETEATHLLDVEFKTLVIRVFTDCLLYTSDAADDSIRV